MSCQDAILNNKNLALNIQMLVIYNKIFFILYLSYQKLNRVARSFRV